MLFLLSPAKSLDYETPLPAGLAQSEPLFVAQSSKLIGVLRKKTARQIAELMHLSEALSSLNVQRYQAWQPLATPENARQAALAFNGDVYGGLDAHSLSTKDLAWAQAHVCMLSGLYGVLRPLDLMQPYRLEMGTALTVGKTKNLYQFWGAQIAQYLNAQQADGKAPVVVNLASQEYFKAVDCKALQARVVDCVFQEWRAGQYKIISFMAKRARGLMARYAITERITSVKKLESFALEGYQFDAEASAPERMVFRRRVA